MRDHDDDDPTATADNTLSAIRRAPSFDARLAQAVRKLHELGPRLVLELEAEIEDLRRQLSLAGDQLSLAGDTTGHGDDSRGAELVGLLRS